MRKFMRTVISAIKSWVMGVVDKVSRDIAVVDKKAAKAGSAAEKAQAAADNAQTTADEAKASAEADVVLTDSTVTGVLPIAKGGTGVATAPEALHALGVGIGYTDSASGDINITTLHQMGGGLGNILIVHFKSAWAEAGSWYLKINGTNYYYLRTSLGNAANPVRSITAGHHIIARAYDFNKNISWFLIV